VTFIQTQYKITLKPPLKLHNHATHENQEKPPIT